MATVENNSEWYTGFPGRKGMYHCRIDGEEMQLYLFICELNPKKKYWTDAYGRRIDEEVEWK